MGRRETLKAITASGTDRGSRALEKGCFLAGDHPRPGGGKNGRRRAGSCLIHRRFPNFLLKLRLSVDFYGLIFYLTHCSSYRPLWGNKQPGKSGRSPLEHRQAYRCAFSIGNKFVLRIQFTGAQRLAYLVQEGATPRGGRWPSWKTSNRIARSGAFFRTRSSRSCRSSGSARAQSS
jgi:hypothetical protein